MFKNHPQHYNQQSRNFTQSFTGFGHKVESGQSCLGKRPATVQVTVFADRVDRVRPTVIFRGNSLRISAKEKQSYNRQVKVMYQEKAWCDQEIMK